MTVAVLTPALRAWGLSKEFPGVRALDDVELTLTPGSVHALIGGNGSGKSTLIKALAGIFPADAGTVALGGHEHAAAELTPRLARTSGLRFVHQQLSVFPDLTVAENLAIGHGWEAGPSQRIAWRRQHRRAAQVLERFDIAIDPKTPLGAYTMATQTMVVVARAMQDLDEAGVLVLDEPTSAFPPAQVELLLGFVRDFARRGHSVIYVTHRLDEVVRVADEATILRDGRVEVRLPHADLSHRRLTEAIMGPAALSVVSRWEKKASEGSALVRVDRLCSGPVTEASFALCPGEIVGLAGLLGSGRTTLLQTIFRALPAEAGTVTIAGKPVVGDGPRAAMRAGIAYVPEDRGSDAAFSGMSVTENLSLARVGEFFRRGRLRHRAEASAARQLIADFRVKTASANVPMSTLSGGNQQKVILARWLRRTPRLILLDEPTQGVDVGARAEIWQLIRRAVDAGACALVATSDLDEMAIFCDRALVIRDGRIVGDVDPDAMTEHNLQRQAFGLEEAV
ncbi:MAG TPA: sugar ABC transporter ATP-binding protein [Jatrophihabitantaceae bacterium]|jgi:ribose transport system ATP-binding protein